MKLLCLKTNPLTDTYPEIEALDKYYHYTSSESSWVAGKMHDFYYGLVWPQMGITDYIHDWLELQEWVADVHEKAHSQGMLLSEVLPNNQR